MNANLFEDAARVRHVKKGDIIKARDTSEKGTRYKKYKVIKVYPYMVLAEWGKQRRCFSFGDLLMMGLEHQDPAKEMLRKGTFGEY